MKTFERIFPWAILLIIMAYLVSTAARTTRNKSDFDLVAFGNLPVQTGGRIKPLDTLARNSLYAISHKAAFVEEIGEGDDLVEKKQPATRWFADMLFNEQRAAEHKVFRIVNDHVLGSLGLEPRKGFRYAYTEIAPDKLREFQQWARDVSQKEQMRQQGMKADITVDDAQASAFDSKLAAFSKALAVNQFPIARGNELTQGEFRVWMQRIFRESGNVPRIIPTAEEDADWSTIGTASFKAIGEKVKGDMAALEAVDDGTTKAATFVAEAYAATGDNSWINLLWKMRDAYRHGRPDEFNALVAQYHAQLGQDSAASPPRLFLESFMNGFQPFIQCIALTLITMILVVISWFGWRRPMLRAAMCLAIVTLIVQTTGLFARMYLEDRPFVFVTNLYSSAVFIGWVVVMVGLFLEFIFRNSVGLTVACVVSFLSLIVAHNLDVAGGGQDNMQVMQAVLDTNFWLATHVTIVTFGYAATFIAGFLGIIYIVLGVFTPVLDKDLSRTLGRMTYGVICAATMLSFIGTVLGGIWADQSWGRFWGWDPKENGALNIVMWNALILHARWGGMVRQRGIAALAVLGNIITTWSWFGTNMLGVGLHSYGKMDRAFFWMMIFMSTQLVIAGFGALWPYKSWLSYEALTQGPPKRRGGKRVSKLSPA